MTELTIMSNPTEFFREQVSIVVKNRNILLCTDVEYYLVNLLCHFISRSSIDTSSTQVDVLETPIAILLKHALEAPPEKQLPIYKALGDTTLYMSGYFQDYFNNKPFSVDYFISIGSNAYLSASDLNKQQHNNKDNSQIFRNLAKNFQSLVDIMADISENLNASNSKTLLSTYEKWINNQSDDRLRQKLEENGINPIPTNIKSIQ